MNARLIINTRELKTALKEMSEHTSRGMQDIANQTLLNIAGRSVGNLNPAEGQAKGKRTEIKGYMERPIQAFHANGAAVIRKRRGGGKPLILANLIVQARRRRAGKPGLYGAEMARATGAFKGQAQRSVGFLKSLFIPVIRALNPKCKFHGFTPYAATANISRWPGSSGYGEYFFPNKDGWDGQTGFQVGVSSRGADIWPAAEGIVHDAIAKAVDDETASLVKHTEEMLMQAYNAANRRAA